MRSDGTAIIIGHLGQDAQVRTTPSGKTVATISVAVNRLKPNGDKIVLWCKAETWQPNEKLLEQLKKGAYVRVVGALAPDEYTSTQTGIVHKGFIIRSAQVILLASEQRDESDAPAAATAAAAPASTGATAIEDDVF